MVARGDLGVEMGFAELAGLQRQIMQEAAIRIAWSSRRRR